MSDDTVAVSEYAPKKVFTVLGSVVTYIQEASGIDKHRIRISLLERI